MKHDYSQSDRYVKIDKPVALPGCCFFCRKATAAFFVDLKMQSEHPVGIAMDGAVYMCAECIDFISRISGYSPVGENVVVENKSLDKELHVEKARVDALEKVIHDLLDSGYTIPDGMVNHVNSILTSMEIEPVVAPVTVEDEGPTDNGTPEPIDDEGVGELHSGKRGILSFG